MWTAEQNLRVAERDVGERGKLLALEREAEMRRVERDRASDVFDLISDAVHALDERVTSTALLLSCLVSRSRHLFFSYVLEPVDRLRVGKEFLALADYKGSGLVVKLSKKRVEALLASGVGQPFAPAGRVCKAWISVPKPDRRTWRSLLQEGVILRLAGEHGD